MASLLSHFKIGQSFVPRFFYGTAWKEETTVELTREALAAGFTAIDTANQRKHYYEEGVGFGIQKYFASLEESSTLPSPARERDNLFLQTKFTFARGQDHRKPYNDNDSFTQQVADSFASSLAHLRTDRIDSYVLHGPHSSEGIGDEDLETWAAMENLIDGGKVKFLGVSNIQAEQLLELCANVRIKPTFVQNRCFARFIWDKPVRDICLSHGLIYQGFSLLTANQHELSSPDIWKIAQKHKKTIAQVVFRFCQQLGMICLTGTSNGNHMRQDLDIYDFELNAKEVSTLENISIHR